MSSEAEVIAGATQGVFNWGEEKIKHFVRKFKDRQLGFIQDDDIIKLVKEQLKTGEWELCSHYLRDRNLKMLVQMGLTLRALDKNRDIATLENLRTKIFTVYGAKGLHIAEFVQNEILSEFVGTAAAESSSVDEMITKIEKLLNNLERDVIFIKKEHTLKSKTEEIITKLQANVPDVCIVFASKTVIPLGIKIRAVLIDKLKKDSIPYDIKTIEEKGRLMLFIFRENVSFLNKE